VGWAIYKIFTTKDQRQLFIGITSDAHWERFCEEFHVNDLWEDLSLRTNEGRTKKFALVNDRVEKIAGELLFASLVDRLEKSQIPHAIVNTPMDLFQDPHLRGRAHFINVMAPTGASTDLPALPMIFDSWQSLLRRNPPKLGEHTVEIMDELGYSKDQIDALIQAEVIESVS
jgi:crotonobetainyl-CoA:carnitine CoA-transferase CaiB-like acyl-CoA transferase